MWLSRSRWANAIYAVDDLNATLHTPMNKGKEVLSYKYNTSSGRD